MRTCYLHLGMPKTGSSSIQDAFYGFSDSKTIYAPLKEKNHGLPLAAAFSHTPANVREFRWRETPPDEIDAIVARMKNQIEKACSGSKSVIFSAEAVIDQLNASEFAGLVQKMRAHFDRVVAIAYVRPLASLASSQMQQRIRMGLREFKLPAPNYRKRFKPVLNVIPREDCIFVRFDRADLFGGDIVEDFAHRLGLEKAPKSDTVTNESLSAEALGALFAFNRFCGPSLRLKDRTKMRRQLERNLMQSGTTKFGLSQEMVLAHLEKYRADIAWIEDICGFDVTGSAREVAKPIANAKQLLQIAAHFEGMTGSKAAQPTRSN